MAAAVSGLLAAPAAAHPHVWVTTKTEVIHDGQGRVTAFHHHWTFDAVFSAFAAQGMDKNGDGKFDREELAELAKVNITSLSEFDFFTFPKLAGKDIELKQPEDGYYLSHDNGMLTLHFVLPLKTPLDPREGEVRFAIYDPTYYVAFSYAEKTPVWLAKNAPAGCQVEMKKPLPVSAQETSLSDLSEAFYNNLGPGSDFGAQFADDAIIACKAG